MPRGDGTGPMGMGPATGRGMGYCMGYARPGYAARGAGAGCGMGRGFGRMCRFTGMPGRMWDGTDAAYGYAANAAGQPVKNEQALLRNQADFLEKQLQQVQERLKKLENNE